LKKLKIERQHRKNLDVAGEK